MLKLDKSFINDFHYSPGGQTSTLRRSLSDLTARLLADSSGDSFSSYAYKIEQHALSLTNGHCFYCNRKMVAHLGGTKKEVLPNVINWDHYIPAALWGVYAMGNIVPACSTCNSEKSDLSAIQYWESRRARKLELRFKVASEIDAITAELKTIYDKELSKLDFTLPMRTIDSGDDIVEFFGSLHGSKIMKGFSGSNWACDSNPRWMRNQRKDSYIWDELNNLDSYVYEKFGEDSPVGIARTSRLDVKVRVSRAIEMLDYLYGDNTSIDDLNDDQFKIFAKSFVKELSSISANEANKAKRLIRTLTQISRFEHLREFAWKDLKSAKSLNDNESRINLFTHANF